MTGAGGCCSSGAAWTRSSSTPRWSTRARSWTRSGATGPSDGGPRCRSSSAACRSGCPRRRRRCARWCRRDGSLSSSQVTRARSMPELGRPVQRERERAGGVALAAPRRPHRVADVAALLEEEVVEPGAAARRKPTTCSGPPSVIQKKSQCTTRVGAARARDRRKQRRSATSAGSPASLVVGPALAHVPEARSVHLGDSRRSRSWSRPGCRRSRTSGVARAVTDPLHQRRRPGFENWNVF